MKAINIKDGKELFRVVYTGGGIWIKGKLAWECQRNNKKKKLLTLKHMIKPPKSSVYGVFKTWLDGSLCKKKVLDDLRGLYSAYSKLRGLAIIVLWNNPVFYTA